MKLIINTICVLVLLVTVMLSGCKTFPSNALGEPDANGGYEAKSCLGYVYAVRKLESKAAKAEGRVMNWLVWSACAGSVAIMIGLFSCYLDKTKKIPCPWWDETLFGGLIVLGCSLVAIKILGILPYLIIGGVAIFGGFRFLKGWKKGRAVNNGK